MILANLPKTTSDIVLLRYETKKIREFNENDFKELYKFILGLSKLIGVTEPPDSGVINMIIEFLIEYYSKFSIQEIQKAFSLAMAGRLNIEFVHYNRITPQLFTSVLNSYEEYSNKEVGKYIKAKTEHSKVEHKPTEKEIEDKLRKYTISMFDNHKNKIEYDDVGNAVYDYLDRKKLIDLTAELKQEILNKCKNIIIQEHKEKVSIPDKPMLKFFKEIRKGERTELVTRAKKEALKVYFDKLIEDNITISNLI